MRTFNPFGLSASDMLVWGIVLHLIADWLFQNDWMANNKMKRREVTFYGDGMMYPPGRLITQTHWWLRHPAAYVHAGIHGLLLALVFGWVVIPLAILHLIIDTRVPVLWWTKKFRQTQSCGHTVEVEPTGLTEPKMLLSRFASLTKPFGEKVPLYDIGTEVQIWVDQVMHIVVIAAFAILAHL